MYLLTIAFAYAAAAQLSNADFETAKVPRHALRQGALLPGDTVELSVYNDLAHQRYLVNISIGTPPKPFQVMVDSGSADLWLPMWNSSGCAPNPCPPGTWRPEDSNTAIKTGWVYNASFGLTPDLRVIGDYYNDTVRIGDVVLHNQTLAVGNVPKPLFDGHLWGILGLGSRLAEALFSNPASPVYLQENGTYDTVRESVFLQGYTSRNIFSVWLNDQAAKTGSILFGGVDETKFEGELQSVPLILSGGKLTGWAVNLTSISRVDGHGKTEEDLTNGTAIQNVVLDSGSPNMYLPSSVVNTILAPLNATTHKDNGNDTPYVLCSFRSSATALEFHFPSREEADTGPKIRVPYKEIIYPFGYPENVGEVKDEKGRDLCYFGMIPTDGFVRLLGATFIRSAYVVYDVENLEIRIAQTKYLSY